MVPPFAEEMNKSRRLVSQLMLALAERGFASCLPDLYGTGDSGGEFDDADWDVWQGDLLRACEWASAHLGPINAIQATRLGASMACELVATGKIPPVRKTVLWQPVFDGARHLTQFLRLRTAANLLEAGKSETASALREQFGKGQVVEIAGYPLSGRLASALETRAAFKELPDELGETHWVAVGTERSAGISPPDQAMADKSRLKGMSVFIHHLVGDQFWVATETTPYPELIASSVGMFCAA